MKKIIVLLLCTIIAFPLAACVKQEKYDELEQKFKASLKDQSALKIENGKLSDSNKVLEDENVSLQAKVSELDTKLKETGKQLADMITEQGLNEMDNITKNTLDHMILRAWAAASFEEIGEVNLLHDKNLYVTIYSPKNYSQSLIQEFTKKTIDSMPMCYIAAKTDGVDYKKFFITLYDVDETAQLCISFDAQDSTADAAFLINPLNIETTIEGINIAVN